MIQFDCETTGLQPWSGRQRAFMFQFEDDEGLREALFPETDGPRIQWWFDRGAEEGLEAWNTKYDKSYADISDFTIPGDGKWHDGMVRAHIINERRSVALKAVGAELFGDERQDLQKEVKAWLTNERATRKKEAKENGTELVEPTYEDVPRKLMVPYGIEDVTLTREVRGQYLPLLDQTPELKELYDFEMKVMDALYAMEKRGLPADEQGYRKLEIEVIENLDRLEDEVQQLAGTDDFNPKSTPQILEALKRRGADLTFMETEGGVVKSANAENLEAVDDDLAKAILRFRGEFKVLSTYVRPMLGRHYDSGMRMWLEPFIAPDGRIHANYRQLGARTGRMSCSGPNMQNQPRDDLRLRYNIKAEPGHKLVACDLSNIEMRVFAAYAGEGRMLKATRAGEDQHTMTAKLIGITDFTRSGGEIESARQRGKKYNFSIIYGGGMRTVRRQLKVDMATARALRRRYFEAYPEIETLQAKLKWRLEEQGFVKDLWGRRYRCWNADKEAYKFVNYLIQGTAAEILKDAVVSLHADGVPIVALVHDEVVAHVPEGEAKEVEQLIIKRLTQQAEPGGKFWNDQTEEPIVPLAADGGIFDRWSDAKPKPDGSLFIPEWAAVNA